MKKKVLFIVMSLCILMLAGGCNKKDPASDLDNVGETTDETTDETSDETTDETTESQAPVKEAFVVSDYITLGEYKGIEVTVTPLEVTDEDIDAAISEALAANATQEEVTGRAVQDGDTVNINFEGLLDGVAFEGGTAEGYDLVIGSGSFIPGFEEGIIGANIGDELALDLTFPEDYDAEMAGKAVVFNVKVNSISQSILPELTESYVQENTDYDTIDAYKEATRADLQAANEDTMENEKINNVMTAIVDNAEISSIPQTLLDYYSYSYKEYNSQMINYMYGMTLADYFAATGTSEEDFNAYVLTVAENYATSELVQKAIAEAEGMEITDEEYKEKLPQYITDYGYESEEALLQYETVEQTKENMLLEEALNFVADLAVVK
jgi:trigger factor